MKSNINDSKISNISNDNVKIKTLSINHKIKNLEPIFSVDGVHIKNKLFIVSGGMNGEMKIWNNINENINLIKCYKKHTGAVTTVKFSKSGEFLASAGDDGRVILYRFSNIENSFEKVAIIKHSSDATHVNFTSSYLISTDIDGTLIFTDLETFRISKRTSDQPASIIGLAVHNNQIVTFSDERICLYDGIKLIKFVDLEKGVIVENMNCRLSFCPSGAYFTICLQFNNKRPCVDLYNLNLEKIYSFMGHAAPIEITSFNPNLHSFSHQESFSVIALASQDNSISFWTTFSPIPFLLLKNFSEAPALDMFWNNNSLFVSTYDGLVKEIEFTNDFFGKIAKIKGKEFLIPFSSRNIEISEIKYKFIENCNKKRIKLSDELIAKPINFKLEIKENNVVIEDEKIDNLNDLENKKFTNSEDEKFNKLKETKSIENLENNLEKMTDLQHSGKSSIDSTNSDKKKINRIIPKSINNSKSITALFNIDTYKLKNTENLISFSKNINKKSVIYKVEYTSENDVSKLTVYRNDIEFYSFYNKINRICFNENFLILYTKYIQIYSLGKGILMHPFLFMRVEFMNLLENDLLIVTSTGEYKYLRIDSELKIIESGFLPKTKGLIKVSLIKNNKNFINENSITNYDDSIVINNYENYVDKNSKKLFSKDRNELNDKIELENNLVKNFIQLEYENGEILSLQNKLWIVLNPVFNSISNSNVSLDINLDQTVDEIENSFLLSENIGQKKNFLNKLISIVIRENFIDEYIKYKIENMMDEIYKYGKGELREFLERLNEIISCQEYVCRLYNKYLQ